MDGRYLLGAFDQDNPNRDNPNRDNPSRDNPSRDKLGQDDVKHDKLIGITGMFRNGGIKTRHKASIVSVYVDPAWRGKGVAGTLIDHTVQRAQAMAGVTHLTLHVSTSNRDAVRLYQSRGFEMIGTELCAIRIDDVCYDQHSMQRLVVRASD